MNSGNILVQGKAALDFRTSLSLCTSSLVIVLLFRLPGLCVSSVFRSGDRSLLLGVPDSWPGRARHLQILFKKGRGSKCCFFSFCQKNQYPKQAGWFSLAVALIKASCMVTKCSNIELQRSRSGAVPEGLEQKIRKALYKSRCILRPSMVFQRSDNAALQYSPVSWWYWLARNLRVSILTTCPPYCSAFRVRMVLSEIVLSAKSKRTVPPSA